jgi:hypothetical protein
MNKKSPSSEGDFVGFADGNFHEFRFCGALEAVISHKLAYALLNPPIPHSVFVS